METEQKELLRLLFVEATARIETAHESAIMGQSAELTTDGYASAARRLRVAVTNIAALADAALVIVADPRDDTGFDHINNAI